MADAMVVTDARAAAAVSEQTEFSRTGEVLREIARGGISGVAAGGVDVPPYAAPARATDLVALPP